MLPDDRDRKDNGARVRNPPNSRRENTSDCRLETLPRSIAAAIVKGERRWVGLELEIETGNLIVGMGGNPFGKQATVSVDDGRSIVWFECTPELGAIDLRRFRTDDPAPRARILGTITAASFDDDRGGSFFRGPSARARYYLRRMAH